MREEKGGAVKQIPRLVRRSSMGKQIASFPAMPDLASSAVTPDALDIPAIRFLRGAIDSLC